jgi:UDP-2,3-diacylglucosamine pyrophosphatase LpxH
MPTKTVIISDVHLSDGPTKYSWFKDDSKLKGFLNDTAKRADVKELVLLGDIFDLWLYPVNVAPWTAKQIIQKWSGADSVVSALKECANKLPDVFYINGNHDMDVTAADLALISPKIKFRTSDQYNAAHANILHLEHGHLVDMFNAPDISGDAIKGLPFGYFITRLMATANNHNDLWEELADIVSSHLKRLFFHNNFIRVLKKIRNKRINTVA